MADEGDAGAQLVVTGEGVALAQPDSCVIGVTLNAMRETIADALRAVTTVADAVMTTLRESGLSDADLPTRNIGVRDWYDQQTGHATARVATYSLAIVVRDLDAVSSVVEALGDTAGDALQIQGIAFSHSDPAPLREAARRDAVADAKARAEQLASAAGLRLGPIQRITEGGGPEGFAYRAVAMSAEAALPINPGNQGVTASVTITFGLLHER